MQLAKQSLDFGLYTEDAASMLAFWQQEVGLPFEETLPAGGGVHQHRHRLQGGVLKLNHSRDPLPPQPPSGYRELVIARDGQRGERRLVDPDGNQIRLVAPQPDGITHFGVSIGAHDPDRHHAFYTEVLGLESTSPHEYRWGTTILRLERDPLMPADAALRHNARMRAPGFRYLTVQVWNVDDEYARAIAAGALDGHAPMTLGRVARIAFIRDPDGNWIEISQRRSLTGDLPAA